MILLSPAIKIVSNLFIVPAGALKYDYAPGESFFWHVIAAVWRKHK